jgi:hypothetical protein
MNNGIKATEPVHRSGGILEREPYDKPAIIYEGRITVRAGSAVIGFTGDPFDPFGGPAPPDEG